MSLASMLRSIGTLQRSTSTKDASGGATKGAWSEVTTAACDIQPASSDVREQYMQQKLVVSHSVFVADDVGARAGDRWLFGTRYFLVQGYTPPAPGYPSWPGRIDGLEQMGIP